MLMVINVSNTTTTLGLFKGNELERQYRLTTRTPRTSDEYGVLMRDMVRMTHFGYHDVTGMIIASAVPNVMHSLTNACLKYFNIMPMIVGPGLKTGIKVRSANQKEAASAFIANAAAVKEIYGGPAIVVDYGTATTYQLVLKDGTLDSVVIAPGIQTSLNALVSETAKLMEVEIRKPDTILTNDTAECIQAGIVYGTIGETEYIVRKMKEASGLDPVKVVATGGIGEVIANETDCIDFYDELLTLQGLRIIYNKCRKREGSRASRKTSSAAPAEGSAPEAAGEAEM